MQINGQIKRWLKYLKYKKEMPPLLEKLLIREKGRDENNTRG